MVQAPAEPEPSQAEKKPRWLLRYALAQQQHSLLLRGETRTAAAYYWVSFGTSG